jgi:hypothetical protein
MYICTHAHTFIFIFLQQYPPRPPPSIFRFLALRENQIGLPHTRNSKVGRNTCDVWKGGGAGVVRAKKMMYWESDQTER